MKTCRLPSRSSRSRRRCRRSHRRRRRRRGQTCAPCHSRRGVLSEGFHGGDEFCDFYNLELLRDDTYFADGQIKDEVYVYGSFVQSKMYHKGIRCTDCHDPHSLKLKSPGNETCTSCHQHAAGTSMQPVSTPAPVAAPADSYRRLQTTGADPCRSRRHSETAGARGGDLPDPRRHGTH